MALMAFAATLAGFISKIPELGAFWRHFFLATCMVVTILELVEIYLLNKESDIR